MILRIANNTDAPLKLQVRDADRAQLVSLPVGKVLWIAGQTRPDVLLQVEVHSQNAGWGRLILDDPTIGYPSAKVAYYGESPSDTYDVNEEIYYNLRAGDQVFALTIKRLQDPQAWMSEPDASALSPNGKQTFIADWAMFTVSIDKMDRKDA